MDLEPTEAMTLLHRVKKGGGSRFLVSDRCFPQTLDVLRVRAEPLGIDLQVGPMDEGAGQREARAHATGEGRGHRGAPILELNELR